MSCNSANSRAPVTLIQSFLFNFKSPRRLQESTLSSLEVPQLLSPLSFLFSPFMFYVISLFLCLISFRYNLEVVCGSYHSLSLCLPAYQFVHLFVFLSPRLSWRLPFRNRYGNSSRKNNIWCLLVENEQKTPFFFAKSHGGKIDDELTQ